MKTTFPLLVSALLLASCVQKVAPPQPKTPAISKTTKPKQATPPKPYPLKTCLVSGEGLDEMDERVSTVYKGQTYEFCCKPCLVKFKKDPEKFATKLAKNTKSKNLHRAIPTIVRLFKSCKNDSTISDQALAS